MILIVIYSENICFYCNISQIYEKYSEEIKIQIFSKFYLSFKIKL